MEVFFMFGKYNPEALREMSIQRTDQVLQEIRNLGGHVNSMHALLGEYDLLFCVNLPGLDAALKASVVLTKITQISFTTYPAITVEAFDRIMANAFAFGS